MGKLDDRIALVTGAGSGIGRATALLFAREGARVVVNDIDAEAAGAVVAELATEGLAVVADVSDSAQVRDMFARVDAELGRLDILVNNAGIGETAHTDVQSVSAKATQRLAENMAGGPVTTHWDITQAMPDEEWHQMIAVHLSGTFYCSRQALALMARNDRGGAIVNMSSVAGLAGLEIAPHYSAAKAGILGFTRALAREVGSRNIRVNAICPGFIDTPMTAPLDDMTRTFVKSQTPLGRIARPDEVATVALFLVSDDSSFVTGQWLSPNGGLHMA